MPVPDNHPLHEEPVEATTATVATGQSAIMRSPYTGRLTKIAACPGVATGGATATCTVSIAGTAVPGGVILIPISTATDTGVSTNAPCNEGDQISFAFTGSGTGGGVVGLTAYVRRGG